MKINLLSCACTLALLTGSGCFGPHDHSLFEAVGGASAAAATSSGAAAHDQAGTDSGTGAQASGAAAGSSSGGVSGGGAQAVAGKEGGDVAGAPGTAGSRDQPLVIEDCSMLEGAVTSELNQHCYRLGSDELTFSQARDACAESGGHLVSISSEAENDFVAELHDGEHWIGASDGRSDTMSGVGPYSWTNEEEWSYSNWEEDQPNAFETDCPEPGDEADCFEHCAFQTDSGDWNDRSCWHTIVSICEWDL